MPTEHDLAAGHPEGQGGGPWGTADEEPSEQWRDERVGRRRARVAAGSLDGGAGAAVAERRWADAVADGPAGPRDGRHARAPYPRAWVRLPAALVGARWQPGRAAVVGIVVVVALAVALFGLRVAWAGSTDGETVLAPGGGSRAGPTGVTARASPVGVTGQAGGTSATTGAPSGAPKPVEEVVVHVVGRVRHPGVRRLPSGSRVAEAVEAAGGVTAKADVSLLNLARVLVDGEQVRVPAQGESPAPVASAGSGGGAASSPGGGAGAPVSLNAADLAALDTLPGVGPVLAQRILDWRAAHGRFTSIDELGEVSGIGEKLLAQLGPLVTL